MLLLGSSYFISTSIVIISVIIIIIIVIGCVYMRDSWPRQPTCCAYHCYCQYVIYIYIERERERERDLISDMLYDTNIRYYVWLHSWHFEV